MSAPASNNPQYNLDDLIESWTTGWSWKQWQRILGAINACQEDILTLWYGIGGESIQDVQPLSGGTVVSNGSSVLALNPVSTLSSLTVVFPANPVNAQVFNINSTQQITNMTFMGGTVQFYTGAFTFNAGVARFIYDGSQNKWLLN